MVPWWTVGILYEGVMLRLRGRLGAPNLDRQIDRRGGGGGGGGGGRGGEGRGGLPD